MDNKKIFKRAKSLFNSLKTDPASVIFAEEFLDNTFLKKIKKSNYSADKQLYILINLADTKNLLDDDAQSARADYVEKIEIDRSTLYSFNGPFQLLHADVGKNAMFPQYVLVIVDLYSLKIYTYTMKSHKQILQKLKLFYDDVRSKRKGKQMRFQVDNEFQQVKIKDLNELNNVDMFTTSVRGSKAFAAEQKVRGLKTRVAKLNTQKLKLSPAKIIERSTLNMNLMKNKKYGMSPEEIEHSSLAGEYFKAVFNMHRLENTQNLHRRQDNYGIKKYSAKRKKLRDELFVGEKVFVFAERIKKKAAPGKFYKQSVQNISYFNKDRTFTIKRIQSIDGIKYYWLKDAQNNKNLTKRFQRTELFALRGNFVI